MKLSFGEMGNFEEKKYSPEEMAQIERDRTLSDAERLKEGAKYKINETGNKRLDLTNEQIKKFERSGDKNMILEQLKYGHIDAFFEAPEEFRADKNIMMEVVKLNPRSLELASPELLNDKEIVLEAVKREGWTLRYASPKLQNDREVVIEAVRQDGSALESASSNLQVDSKIVLEAIKHGYDFSKYTHKEILNDKAIKSEITKRQKTKDTLSKREWERRVKEDKAELKALEWREKWDKGYREEVKKQNEEFEKIDNGN